MVLTNPTYTVNPTYVWQTLRVTQERREVV